MIEAATLLDAAVAPDREPASARERSERIYRIIRDRICLLEYPPGQRLSEEELAQEFAVSRTPVRRVLTRLESEGMVEIVHGVGTIVTAPDLEQVTQVYHLRVELAVLAGKLSPIPREQSDLDRVRALIARCDQIVGQPDHREFARLNMAFFSEITAMTGNAPLREISERLYFQAARIVLKLLPVLNLVEEFSFFRQEMVEILSAMEINDLESVGHLRRAHISMSFSRIQRYLQTHPSETI
jgi:DNA-binding GntR family transcriptional regulator